MTAVRSYIARVRRVAAVGYKKVSLSCRPCASRSGGVFFFTVRHCVRDTQISLSNGFCRGVALFVEAGDGVLSEIIFQKIP